MHHSKLASVGNGVVRSVELRLLRGDKLAHLGKFGRSQSPTIKQDPLEKWITCSAWRCNYLGVLTARFSMRAFSLAFNSSKHNCMAFISARNLAIPVRSSGFGFRRQQPYHKCFPFTTDISMEMSLKARKNLSVSGFRKLPAGEDDC